MGRRLNSFTDSRRYYDWLDRAGEDLRSAGILAAHDDCYNAAAFHCQQAIEKALKSYILLKSDLLVDGHNLPWLCKRAAKYDRTFTNWLAQSALLSRCYIETRYPADIPLDITGEQIRRYFDVADSMYRFICEEVEQALAEKKAHPAQRAN